MILVTKPFSPPVDEYINLLEGIWSRNYFTNNGPLVIELEERLEQYLDVRKLYFVSNGTISLQIVLKCLDKGKRKILTTPFTYIATASSIVWEGFEPVFIDIDNETFNVDASKIEEFISLDVAGMLFTHCFGNPCKVEVIDTLSEKYNIPIIYDAAHAFGVKYKNTSILNYGLFSSLSFHSTKLFHTVEGGGIVVNDPKFDQEIALRRNFGHNGPEIFDAIGINGKNSEFHAAMGIVNMKYIDEILTRRRDQYLLYCELLKDLPIQFQKIEENTTYNYAYMPIVLSSEKLTSLVIKRLEESNISPRRYFYPPLNQLEIFGSSMTSCPVAESISSRILCLPIYHTLLDSEIKDVVKLIEEVLKSEQ